MTESSSNSPPPEKQTLDYATPPPRPAGGVPYGVQVLISTVATVAIMLMSVVPARFAGPEYCGAIMMPVVVFAMLLSVASHLQDRWRWRGLFMGAFIGFGLVLLVAGVFFVFGLFRIVL